MNVTVALALMSIILIEAAGVRKERYQRLVKEFCGTNACSSSN